MYVEYHPPSQLVKLHAMAEQRPAPQHVWPRPHEQVVLEPARPLVRRGERHAARQPRELRRGRHAARGVGVGTCVELHRDGLQHVKRVSQQPRAVWCRMGRVGGSGGARVLCL